MQADIKTYGDVKKACQGLTVCFFVVSTSSVTWTWLALLEIMLRSKGRWPLSVEPTSSVMNRTSRGTVWSKLRMPSGRAWPLWMTVSKVCTVCRCACLYPQGFVERIELCSAYCFVFLYYLFALTFFIFLTSRDCGRARD